MRLYLSIGTNVGDRRLNISRALEKLELAFGDKWKSLSDILETKSWGFEGADFLNCVVCFESEFPPEEVLEICKQIEKQMGRDEQVEYGVDGKRIYHDRVIDIDIILYGNLCINTPTLRIPHPMMREREFVMKPLMQILDENDYICKIENKII